MKRIIVLVLVFFCGVNFLQILAQETKPIVYLIPGQGGDQRVYNNLNIDTSCYDIKHIQYFTPKKGWSMYDFAKQLAKQIDTTRQFSIVGVSLGGMLATEISHFLNPEKTIIISSAKNRKELPFTYRFQKTIPIYKTVPKGLYKLGAKILQPIVEPDRRYEKDTFKAMLSAKDPAFLKKTTAMIMEWERENTSADIIHIHGNRDRTIPQRNVKYNFLIDEGSHMMVLTRGDEVSSLVNNILIHK